MKITSAADPAAPGTDPTDRFGRRQARAVVTALVGLILLATAHALPWVAVRPGQSVEDRLFGRAPSTEVRTYALADLSGARAPLYVGWALLLALLVAALARPQWGRAARLAAAALVAVTAFLTFLPGGVAVRGSGFAQAAHPDTSFLAGTWLALLGLLLLFRAAWAVAAAPPAPATAPPGAAAPATTGGQEEPGLMGPGPLVIPRPGWARAPERVPWWRRPGPVAAALAGGLAGAALLGAVIWQIAHRPADPHGDLPALLVARPADSTPAAPAASDDQVNAMRLVPSGADLRSMLLLSQLRSDVRHAAGTAWTRPDAATVTVTLLQFDSAESADDFQRSYVDVLGAGERVPDLPGAAVFSADEQGRAEVDAIDHRGDVVVLVSADGGMADTRTTVVETLRQQYARL